MSADKEVYSVEEDNVEMYSPGDHELTNDFKTISKEEESLTEKARETGQSLRDLVSLSVNRAKEFARDKVNDLNEKRIEPGAIAAKKDATDISRLGEGVVGLVETFENTMTIIRKNSYEDQVTLLNGYRKLLDEQINVIDSRIHMARRLKGRQSHHADTAAE